MLTGLVGGGIFLTLIVGMWERIKGFLWSITSMLICRVTFDYEWSKFGSIFVWDKLKNDVSHSRDFSRE